MAKVSSAALASVLATICVASHGMKLGDNHKIHSDALLRNARPYRDGTNAGPSSSRRRLDQNNFEIDASYNLKFSQCVDVKLFDNDLFDEDVIEYTKAGRISSTKSFALFHVCQESDCYYESEDDLYIVDLATYVTNVASYLSNAKSSYCNSCNTYYNNYCAAQGDDAAVANDDGANADDYFADDDAGRKLQNQRRTSRYIDCDQCEAYGCLNDDDDDGRQGDDEENGALELIEDISGCLNTGLNWNDDDLYVGFMCSPYGGDGVELAIFLDNECTVYTSLKAFSDIPSYYIYNDDDLFAEAELYIKNAFTQTIPCLYEEFGNPNYQNNGDDDGAANGDDGYAVNDYCAAVFEEEPIAFNSCVQNDDQNDDQNYNNQNNGNDDDQYNWYSFDLNYDDSRELDEVCLVLQLKEGEYNYQYDEENSGTWNYHSGSSTGTNSQSSGGHWDFLGGDHQLMEGFATSGIMIFLYVMLGFAFMVGTVFIIGLNEKRKRKKTEPVYQGGRLV